MNPMDASDSDVSMWFEVQRRSGPNYGWITLSDHDTWQAAQAALEERAEDNPAWLDVLRVKRVFGTSDE
jgi:hypothetical protein